MTFFSRIYYLSTAILLLNMFVFFFCDILSQNVVILCDSGLFFYMPKRNKYKFMNLYVPKNGRSKKFQYHTK